MRKPKYPVGAKVTYTNQQGVRFPGKTVIGVDAAKWSSDEPRYFIDPTDTPWCSVPENGLATDREVENADLKELHRRLLEGTFFKDYDEDQRLMGVLRRHLDEFRPIPFAPARITTSSDGTQIFVLSSEALEDACRAKFRGWDNPRHYGEAAKALRRAEVAGEVAAGLPEVERADRNAHHRALSLLNEVRQHFTRDDDLPDNLLSRIDALVDGTSAPQVSSPAALTLAARIAAAVLEDEKPENGGCDVSAGLFGPNLSALVREMAHEAPESPEGDVLVDAGAAAGPSLRAERES
ncbi:hypothetical protein [Ramlibacter sp. AN1133]|uniref:hypothetical protein n=1 Tax=Ramlibacter sp. AN1133 TaxID=3133429 RepID=UPI0030BCB9EE